MATQENTFLQITIQPIIIPEVIRLHRVHPQVRGILFQDQEGGNKIQKSKLKSKK